jgi:hypothetical protein
MAACGVGCRGDILPFAGTALFKVPESHTRQVGMRNKSESTFVKGTWDGKHRESDDLIFLTAGGWHRARTVRRFGAGKRADPKVLGRITAVPWQPRSARPVDEHVKPHVESPLVASALREEQLTTMIAGQAATSSVPAAGAVSPAEILPAAPPRENPSAPAAVLQSGALADPAFNR